MKMRSTARIIGLGTYLPARVLTNQDLEQMVDTSNEWIVTRTGMKERRIAKEDEYPSDMGIQAALKALDSAKLSPQDIDLILVATMTPDFISPSTASLVQAGLGAPRAFAMDIQAACSGFLYALSVAKAYIESEMCERVLVVATEKMSAFIDYEDRSTCVLFGDGAGAAVVAGKGAGLVITTLKLGSEGSLSDMIKIAGGGARHPASEQTVKEKLHFFTMNGTEVFKQAVRRMSAAAKECLTAAHLREEEISWLIPHQANIRIMDALAKHFNIADEKVFKTVHKYGNTSASSIPIALDELMQQGCVKEGDHLLLTTVGGGLTWGACILSKTAE